MIKLRYFFHTAASIGLMLLLTGCKLAILDPKGAIAADEKRLLVTAVLLMLIVVIPVILMTGLIAYRYREGNTQAKYSPEWAHSTILEIIWWTIPCIIIAILATITWISSHRLDPYRPLAVETKPVTIQAIALEWKWLFIYPDQHIATVNYVELPAHVPIQFLITADAPMNSFQIPQLAGQIYAMAGMQTKLNLIANETGDFSGLSTNFSGNGFSNMKFNVHVASQEEFDQWTKTAKKSHEKLTMEAYNKIAQPSENDPVAYYSAPTKDLFNTVIMKFMMPMKNMQSMNEDSTSANK